MSKSRTPFTLNPWHTVLPRLWEGPRFWSMSDLEFPTLPTSDTGLTELHKDGSNYILKIMVPGFTKEEISLEVTKNHIIVEAKKEETPTSTLVRGAFPTQLTYKEQIPANLDATTAEASLENGVLTVTVGVLDKRTPSNKVVIR